MELFRSKPAPLVALLLLVGATTVVLGPGVAGASSGPGKMSASPASVVAGSTGDAIRFTYTAVKGATTKGMLELVVPAGWTAPQTSKSANPGYFSVASKTCSAAKLGKVTGGGPWTVAITVTCASAKKLVLSYSHVSAPTVAGTDQFPASLKVGTKTTPLTTSPKVTVDPGTLDHLVLQGSLSSVAPDLTSSTANYSGPMTSTYTAQGVDQYGNTIGDETADTTFGVAPDGGCSGSVCDVASAGTHTVTGTDGSATGTASLLGDESLLVMSCKGFNFDVDGAVDNGCEVNQPDHATSQGTADSLGAISCNDGNGDTVSYDGFIDSDSRVHENPTVPQFSTTTGSAPLFKSIDATGGSFCENDVVLTLQVNGSASPNNCYELTAITNLNTTHASTNSSGTATIDDLGGQYSDNTTVYLEVQKTCDTTTLTESVTYSVNGHL